MANLPKKGLDYYSVDTNRYGNRKIRRIIKSFGTDGVAVYDYILSETYRDNGCFLVWDQSRAFDVADYFGLKESTVNEIVSYCGTVGLFDNALLTGESIITSRSIQQRYTNVCRLLRRKEFEIPASIKLITEEIPNIPALIELPPASIDKGKEKKVNEIKEINIRKVEFRTALISFETEYGLQMVKDFYDYWTEIGENQRLLRFEREDTFEIKKRLARWKKNADNFKNGKNNYNNVGKVGGRTNRTNSGRDGKNNTTGIDYDVPV